MLCHMSLYKSFKCGLNRMKKLRCYRILTVILSFSTGWPVSLCLSGYQSHFTREKLSLFPEQIPVIHRSHLCSTLTPRHQNTTSQVYIIVFWQWLCSIKGCILLFIHVKPEKLYVRKLIGSPPVLYINLHSRSNVRVNPRE